MKRILLLLSVLLLIACNREDRFSALSAPSEVLIEQTSMTSVQLNWKVGSTYDGTTIERAAAGEDVFEVIADLPENVLSYEDESMTEEGRYHYRLATYRKKQISEYVYISFDYLRLPAPTDFNGEKGSEGFILSWKDNCKGEEGYVIEKKSGTDEFKVWKVLGPDVETVTDEEITAGEYDYMIYAFHGDERSEALVLHVDNYYAPKLKLGPIRSSWRAVNLPIVVNDDGGYPCKVGFCWRDDGAKGAVLSDNSSTFPFDANTGDICMVEAVGLEPGKTYSFRPWVSYNGKMQYFNEITAKLEEHPDELTADWEDISDMFGMPESVRLYHTQSLSGGEALNAWYAIADMSFGDLEFRSMAAPSPVEPSVFASGLDGMCILINGGYFQNDQSLSYILNQGVVESEGIMRVRGEYAGDDKGTMATKLYNVTRGAFGVDQGQHPSIKWIFGTTERAYDSPLPVYNSGPVMAPTASFPSVRHEWNVCSAIGGGPVILDNGRLSIDYLLIKDKGNGGHFASDFEMVGKEIFAPDSKISRTAVGHTADGKIVLMVVDGEGANGSGGVSLLELALLMKGVGCTDVLNLDGGDSSLMCVTPDAVILNAPSGGNEKAVLSFVALVEK